MTSPTKDVEKLGIGVISGTSRSSVAEPRSAGQVVRRAVVQLEEARGGHRESITAHQQGEK